MGRTARFDQVYVTSLDADPVEQDVLSTIRSIITSEIEADIVTSDKISIANTNPTKNFSMGTAIMMDNSATNIVLDVTKGIRSERIYANDKIAIAAPGATNEFQIGPNNEFVIDRDNVHLVTLKGNVSATNVLVSNIIGVGDAFTVDKVGSNVLKVVGNTHATNVTVRDYLLVGNDNRVGSNVAVFQGGNVVISGDLLTINGNLQVNGNAFVTEVAQYQTTVNLVVEDAFIQMANTNSGGSFDNALIMTEEKDGSEANLVMGYQFSNNEFLFGRTFAAPPDTKIIVDEANTVNLHVYGQFYTSGNVGVANITTGYTLSIGSNVYFDDTGSNVMFSRGNVYVERLRLGSGGAQLGSTITINDNVDNKFNVDSNIQAHSIRTTGASQSGISNTSPTDTLSVGAKIFANLTTANTLTILGNTTTTNLLTGMIYTHTDIVVHADRYGGDSTSNALSLKSGPTASNVSSIEVYGASTSNTHQNIRFKTKNTERVRVASTGYVGIANTNPTEALTVAGNVHVIGSNAVVCGNTWGSKGMRIYSTPSVGENKVENIVAEGKGLNFYASQTSTMGNPKVTILENSNVGINVANPIGRLHTSGGTVFINDQVTNRGTYVHQLTPMVITNTSSILSTTDMGRVLDLTREGDGIEHGARASFKLGKHETSDGTSRTRFDLYLASDNYQTDADVMTFLSSGKVGIGSTQPSAFLEVTGSGFADPTENGILLHNENNGDAIVAVETKLNVGNAFTSYILEDGGALTGWSAGVTKDDDFRITENYRRVLDSSATAIFISSAERDVGIGTDAPRGKLEVSGNVVIGNRLDFAGLTGDEFGNTVFVERSWDSDFDKNELVIFKGNKTATAPNSAGPSRIRHIAGEHIFQTINIDGETFEDTIDTIGEGTGDVPLCITDLGTVVIGGSRIDAAAAAARTNTKLIVKGDIEFAGTGTFKLTGFQFLTTTGASSRNIIRNVLNGVTRRPLLFTHDDGAGGDNEFARFSEEGYAGFGTSTPNANVHVYSAETTDMDLLKLESPGTNKETGMLIYTGDGEGGYLRGFSNSDNGTTGLIMGVANNSILTNCIHVIQSSNVGVGTNAPGEKLHIYDGKLRVEHSSSNATIEFKTTGGTANIYADTTGNVYINPLITGAKNTTFLNSNVEVIGDFSVDGALDLGNQVAIGLGGASANTSLHVNGGVITNSDQVATKRYSKTFSLNFGDGQDIQLTFRPGTFYARVVAVLRETSDVRNTSTMILELSGGTHDGTTLSMHDIAIGTKNLFGATNSYPWSPTVTAGKRSIDIRPALPDASERNYNYDISVEVTSACDGGLTRISHDIFDFPGDLDDGTGGQDTLALFAY
jgi:hypothetical protein